MRKAPAITPLDWRATPQQVAARWPADRPLIWLHSGRVHARWARWSILASPRAVIRFDGRASSLHGELSPLLQRTLLTGDPLADLDAVLRATALDSRAQSPTDSPWPFQGGWIGHVSYDLGRVIEPRAQDAASRARRSQNVSWPLIELAWCPDALLLDWLTEQWHRVANGSSDQRPDWIDALDEKAFDAASSQSDASPESGYSMSECSAELDPREYERMAARTIEYIAAGDIFQANIAQSFTAEFNGSTRALAIDAFSHAQPWYGAYLELMPVEQASLPALRSSQTVEQASLPASTPAATSFSGRHGGLPHYRALLSLSPELFLHVDPLSRCVTTRPIKGTRPSTAGASELRESSKDAAELHMIVDLMRNDLGRVCETGSVRVAQPRMIESHPTVHHGVAEIVGRLRADFGAGDLLRAAFPPGSVTGAPKIRAMQIIDELEGAARGPYCGAIGCFSDCGAITLNVAIRTLLLEGEREPGRFDMLRDGMMSYSAGAGIVADSIPAREQQETLDKTAVLRTLASPDVSQATSRPQMTQMSG